jgi:hypothetical protein
MKVNLKKIGAIVAGATILASSVAFAGLTFGSTQLVDDNGAPVAKVVIGANAAASDGVAAALIASKLVSTAYKSSTLTASVSGAPTCSAGGAGGAGSCTISNKQATLEITVPGSVATGTYTVNNLIGDYLNRELNDRNLGQQNYTMGADTSDTANPYTNGVSSSLGPNEINLYRISGDMFSPFATATLSDTAAAKSYSEQQDLWIRGNNHYEDTPNDIVGTVNNLGYTLKFKGTSDDLGIPVCTTPTNSTHYELCSTDYLTSTHKMAVKFLGQDWIISEMSPPTTTETSETMLVNGGYVKLAKEAVGGILNQGESLTADDLKFQLDDLEAHGDITSAIISVLDANGNVLKKDTITPGATKEFIINGKDYRFHVYKVAPGYTFGAKWADVAIYSKELKLQDGVKLDPDYDSNKYWTVYLGWKNEGASPTDTAPDHLRTVILYAQGSDIQRLSSGGLNYLTKDDFLPIVQDPVEWKLSYTGLDLGSSDRDDLSFDMERTSSMQLTGTNNGPLDLNGTKETCTLTAPYVHVTSGRSGSVFTVQSALGASASTPSDSTTNEFYVATSGASCVGTVTNIGMLNPGSVFMKGSTSSDSGWTYKNYTGGGMMVLFPAIGDGDQTWALGGVLEWANRTEASVGGGTDIAGLGVYNFTGASGTVPDWVFAISEKAGTGTSNTFTDKLVFGLSLSATTSTFNFDDYKASGSQQMKKDDIGYVYAGPVTTAGSFSTYKEGFISERGSVFNSVSDTNVDFNMANKLAHAQWYLASTMTNATPGTTIWTGGEGDSTTVNDVTVKIDTISATGVCSGGAGGTPACTPNMSGVSAVIMPNNAASVDTMVPYDFSKYSPLVMLDSDAVGVSTVISVGGDAVNTVTASILSGTTVDWTAQPQMVKEVVKGSKIVVAGYTAQDTLAAANTFVSELK